MEGSTNRSVNFIPFCIKGNKTNYELNIYRMFFWWQGSYFFISFYYYTLLFLKESILIFLLNNSFNN